VGDQKIAAQQTAIGVELLGRTYVLTGSSAVVFVILVLGIVVALMSPPWALIPFVF
jgi:hypothetical protein